MQFLLMPKLRNVLSLMSSSVKYVTSALFALGAGHINSTTKM